MKECSVLECLGPRCRSLRVQRNGEVGLTLVEIIIAVAIIAVVLAVSAQALGGFLVAMDAFKEQTIAIQSCRSVLGAIREQRPDLQDNFPSELLAWIDSQNEAGWERFRLLADNFGRLENHTLSVSTTNMAGDFPGAGDNPIVVYVTATWTGLHGRPMRTMVSTILTDR